jgi:hypothetical protein
MGMTGKSHMSINESQTREKNGRFSSWIHLCIERQDFFGDHLHVRWGSNRSSNRNISLSLFQQKTLTVTLLTHKLRVVHISFNPYIKQFVFLFTWTSDREATRIHRFARRAKKWDTQSHEFSKEGETKKEFVNEMHRLIVVTHNMSGNSKLLQILQSTQSFKYREYRLQLHCGGFHFN